jgi:exfoliative toxin A/B
MKNLLQRIPIPITGLMLALAATGNLVASYSNVFRNIFGFLSLIIFLLLVAKALTDTKSVVEGLNNPVTSSVMPTFSMGIMILSTYIKPYIPALAFALWIIGLVLHCILILYFTWKYILKFDIKRVFPSYFIVYVGIAVGSVTAPAFNLSTLGQYIFWFGFITYLILLPIVLYRVFIIKGIPEPALPTVAIFAAPANLCLAGYLNSFHVKDMHIIILLAALGSIMTLSVLFYIPKLLKLKFYPSFSALTFPLVISGIAIKLTNAYLINNNKIVASLKYVVKFEEIISVLIVIYVLLKYIRFVFSNNKTKNNIAL